MGSGKQRAKMFSSLMPVLGNKDGNNDAVTISAQVLVLSPRDWFSRVYVFFGNNWIFIRTSFFSLTNSFAEHVSAQSVWDVNDGLLQQKLERIHTIIDQSSRTNKYSVPH